MASDWHWIDAGVEDWQSVGPGLTSDMPWIDIVLARDCLDRHWVGIRLTMDRHRIGTGLAVLTFEWHQIKGRDEALDLPMACGIVRRWDTSVGPHRILVPRSLAELFSDWHGIDVICADACQCTANL